MSDNKMDELMIDWTHEMVMEALNNLRSSGFDVRSLESEYFHFDHEHFVAVSSGTAHGAASEKLAETVHAIFSLWEKLFAA